MDQDLGPFGEFDEVVRPRRIAGDHDGPIGRVEAIRESGHHWWMVDQCAPDRHLVIAQYQPTLAEFMNMDQGLEGAVVLHQSRGGSVLSVPTGLGFCMDVLTHPARSQYQPETRVECTVA